MRGGIMLPVVGVVLSATLCAGAGSVQAGQQAKKAGPKSEFVGSEQCRKCHKIEYDSWKKTFHSKIVMPRKGGILKEAVEKWAGDGANPGPAVGNVTGKAYKLEDVQYVVGSRWKQRYLVKNEETGNLQFMNMQFNRLTGKWEKYGQKNDWNTQCATCHSTGYRITAYDDKAGKTLKSEFVEFGVGCEACHGPGAKHARSKKKKDIFNPANVDVKAQSLLCGYCHIRLDNEQWKTAQGNPREDFPAPKLGETFRAAMIGRSGTPSMSPSPGSSPATRLTRSMPAI